MDLGHQNVMIDALHGGRKTIRSDVGKTNSLATVQSPQKSNLPPAKRTIAIEKDLDSQAVESRLLGGAAEP